MEQNSKKKKKFKWWYALIALLIIGAIGSIGNKSDDSAMQANEQQERAIVMEESMSTEEPAMAPTPTSTPTLTPEPTPNPLTEDETPEEVEPTAESPEDDSTIQSGRYTLPSGYELNFSTSVRNDTTGNWRISTTSDSFVPADYALEYYETMFSSDDEIHAIWNATLGTMTRLAVYDGVLYVDTLEYVDGEEHDADLLFSGEILNRRTTSIETGETYDYTEEYLHPEPSTTPTPESAVTPAPGTDYVLNTNTMKFHKPSCSSVKKIKDEHRQDYTGSRDDLIAQGYDPCKNCNP